MENIRQAVFILHRNTHLGMHNLTHSLYIIQQPTLMDAEYMNSSWPIYSNLH